MSETIPDTLNSAWKNNKSRFGYKMLQKMGWSEEKGLGKNETGEVNAVKLKKREDGVGLGVEKTTDGAGAKGWSETATSFNSVLDILKATYSKKDKKDKKKKKESKSGESVPLRISVGMKYKKHSLAKALSNKSEAELKSVLGAGHSSIAKRTRANSDASNFDSSVCNEVKESRKRSGSISSVASSVTSKPKKKKEKKEKKEH